MSTRTTAIYPYTNLVVSAAGAETVLAAATGFLAANALPAVSTALGAKSLKTNFAGGRHTYFNAVILRGYATCNDNDTAESTVYGITKTGSAFIPERIATITWIFSTCLRVAGIRWADTVTVADYHIGDVRTADSGNDTIARVELDALGYEYLYCIVHGTTTGAATVITIEMRPY